MSPHQRRRVVMIVEDDASMRKLLRVSLTGAGYTVLEAGDARTALTLAAHEMPDLIVQDLLLPDSAGFSLVQDLRALAGGAEVPIIALSGMQSRLDEAWRSRGGFSAYLRKPVEPSRLEEAVHAYLRPATAAGEDLGQGRRVLIVDDNPAQGKLLAAQLSDWGFQTVVSESAEAALAEARRERPALLVSDVLMPDMDGFRLCLEVRTDASLADLPVVLVSAAAPEDSDFEMARRVAASAMVMGTPAFWGLHDAVARSLAEDGLVAAQEISAGALRLELARRSQRVSQREPGAAGSPDRRGEAHSLELSSLARVAGLLMHRHEPQALLDEALAEGFAALGTCPSAILLVDAEGGLALAAQHGCTPAVLDGLAELVGHPALFASMWSQGAPVVLRDLADPRLARLLLDLRAAALSLTPMLAAGTRTGVLVVVHLDAAPGADRLALAQAMAGLIGPALALG